MYPQPLMVVFSNLNSVHSKRSVQTHIKLDITPGAWSRGSQRGADMTHFIEAFVRNVEEHAGRARQKYDEIYAKAEPEELVITDGTWSC
jgi:hypothetical protein